MVKMTNFVQSKYDEKFPIFSIFLHKPYTILDDFCSILRHNSNPMSFQCSQPLLVFLSLQPRLIKGAGRKAGVPKPGEGGVYPSII